MEASSSDSDSERYTISIFGLLDVEKRVSRQDANQVRCDEGVRTTAIEANRGVQAVFKLSCWHPPFTADRKRPHRQVQITVARNIAGIESQHGPDLEKEGDRMRHGNSCCLYERCP